ncbi:hypothetical protein BH11BAC5_BH11BAC5_52510 [soil metagenome]
MKKVSLLFAGLFLLLSVNLHAQSKTGAEYFTGKWSVLVKGTPNGDARMFIVLDKKDSTLAGIVQDSTGKEMTKIDKIELAGDKATVYFSTQGYDVNLELNKKNDDHVTGNLMGMFDADGDRVKAVK